MVRPLKVVEVLQREASKFTTEELEVDLVHDLIAGPFNYGNPQDYNNKAHYIPDDVWLEIIRKEKLFQVDTSNINKIIPVPT